MIKSTIVVLLLAFLAVAGCTNTGGTNTPKTQLEIREFQTRVYATNDVKLVMKVLFSVLQDDGFIVKNASTDLGLLSATKEVHVESQQQAAIELPALGHNERWRKNSVIDATANISEFGNTCKVRVNFQIKMLSNSGRMKSAQPVEDGNYYQRFFSKVDKGLFIQAEKL